MTRATSDARAAAPLRIRFDAGLVLRYEFKNLTAGLGVRLALLLALAAGLYSVYYGKAEMDEQRRVIRLLPAIQRGIDEGYVRARFGDSEHSGRFAYYLTTVTGHEPSPWAGLSIGQRDLNPYFLGMRLLGLYSQLYESGMENPLKALSGNFDLAFVIVFLFPLLVIGLSYNLISGEEDHGTLRLLRSLGTPLLELVAVKFAARFAVVFGLAALLLGAALAWHGVPLSSLALAWLGVIAAYLLFWFGVVFFVAAFGRSSAFNATALLGAWLALGVVVPAAMNVATSAFFPVPYAYEIAVRHRNEINAGWDRPKEVAFQRFFRTHPEWKDTLPVKEAFAWKWYYAMHEAGDEEVRTLADSYADHLRLRQSWARGLGLISPPVGVQLMFDELAQTDLDSHLAYLEAVKASRRRLEAALYPAIFNEEKFAPGDLAKLRARAPDRDFREPPMPLKAPEGLLELSAATALLFLASPWILRARHQGEGA
ncbi:MAG: DUF3526 domain-containing protein [Proteobacteria bacterium]|nr:DUF3526 domain-containing protein [Pseudomonadota bacterium]